MGNILIKILEIKKNAEFYCYSEDKLKIMFDNKLWLLKENES